MPYTTVKSSNRRIHYFDTKDAEPDRGNGKPSIIMIHGLGSSQNYYMPVIPELPSNRCIALDTYGVAPRDRSRPVKL